MERIKKKKSYQSTRAFKKRFDEAIERDKKSMLTEKDKEFLLELQKMTEKNP